MNDHSSAGIDVPRRLVPALCRALDCAADDIPAALASLDDDGLACLRHPVTGLRVELTLALPWRDAITWRVARLARETPAPRSIDPALPRSIAPTYRTLFELLGERPK
jgi:hypothetical protein